jgi:hypothetical protein
MLKNSERLEFHMLVLILSTRRVQLLSYEQSYFITESCLVKEDI